MKFIILKYDDIQFSFYNVNDIKYLHIIDGDEDGKSLMTIRTTDQEIEFYALGEIYYKILDFLKSDHLNTYVLYVTDFK